MLPNAAHRLLLCLAALLVLPLPLAAGDGPDLTVDPALEARARWPKDVPDLVYARRLEAPEATYTEEALAEGITGTVIVQAIVDEEGRTHPVKVRKGLPAGLDARAVEAVARYRWEPATVDGEPVAVYESVVVHFTPDSDLPTRVRRLKASAKEPEKPDPPAADGSIAVDPELAARVVEVAEDDPDYVRPQRTQEVVPSYTEAAREEAVEGVVRVKAIVDAEGTVHPVQVLDALPHGLTEAALDAMRQWRFEPATLDGEPVAVHLELTTRFSLE